MAAAAAAPARGAAPAPAAAPVPAGRRPQPAAPAAAAEEEDEVCDLVSSDEEEEEERQVRGAHDTRCREPLLWLEVASTPVLHGAYSARRNCGCYPSHMP